MDYKALAEKLVNRGLRRGADEVEVYLQTSRNLSIRVRQEDLETIQESDAGGVAFASSWMVAWDSAIATI